MWVPLSVHQMEKGGEREKWVRQGGLGAKQHGYPGSFSELGELGRYS